MRKRHLYFMFVIFITTLILQMPRLVHAQSPAIASGLTWLNSAQSADGSWGSDITATDSIQATSAAMESLAVLNNTANPNYVNAANWLTVQQLDTTRHLAERLSIFSTSSADKDTILLYRNSNGGWGGETSYLSDNLDTALALQALKAANYSDTTVLYQAINFLTINQNSDGGWGFTSNDPSNAYVTAMVLRALSSFSSTFSVQSSISNAAAFLLAKQTQNNDGGFGSSPSTVYETALSLMALIESGQGSTLSLQNAINYLVTTQSTTNGSWNNDPYSTALALQALSAVRPNLTVSSLSLSKAMPQEGESITITATVGNTGLEDASNVIVRFYSGDPSTGSGQVPGGTQIGVDQIIPSLAPNSSTPISITASFTGTGSKTIFIVVDPSDTISETSESDNRASARLWVATGPDLAIFSEDLKPSTSVPTSGTAFTLEYKIRNLGESEADSFDVAVFDGQPSGTPLQTIHISGINGTEVRTGSVGVSLTTNGQHTLYLVADTSNQITEISKTNNIGTVSVTVGATLTGADLVVTQPDITITPSRPHAGDAVQISARIRNQGAEAAFGFLVEFYDNAPEAGGTLIGSQSLSLAPGVDQIIIKNWTITPGIHSVYVVVDRQNIIVEADKNNNRASTRIMTDMVDISLSATDLAFTPSHPVSNDAVALTITARNTGIINTGAFNLALYDGDPSTGSGQVPASGILLQTFPIANIPGDGSATVTYTFTAVPKTYRFYAVADTENVVTELYEENNTAIRSLKIKAPGEILGPDLVPVKIDLSDTTTDSQTLAISGNAHVTFQNKGDDKIVTPFNVIIFEDKDNDARYTAGVDNLLGTSTMVTGPTASIPAIWPEGAGMVNVPLSGTVKFLHSPLYAMIDSSDAILEQDETNNILVSCKDCEVVPTNPMQPVVKWRWNLQGIFPTSPPAIAPLMDTNGDGKIDDKDIPSVIFAYHGGYNTTAQALVALRGDTGEQILSISDANHPVGSIPYPVVGDINGDGLPEIILSRDYNYGGGLLAYSHDGRLLWDNYPAVANMVKQTSPWTIPFTDNITPVLADLDENGNPEIVLGVTVVNPDGSIRSWASDYKYGSGVGNFVNYLVGSIVADLDLDGKQEIIAGKTAYNVDGTTKWWNKSIPDGYSTVVNFNDDPYPEIVHLAWIPGNPALYLLDHNGNVIWGPAYLKSFEPGAQSNGFGGPPTIADFDGDGQVEIGVKGFDKYLILDRNGHLKNTLFMPYAEGASGMVAAAAVFDLNGDGRPKVLDNGNGYFRIFDGKTGTLLYKERFGGVVGGFYQNVIMADVDGDGQVEAVVIGYDYYGNHDSMRVYKSDTQNGAAPWIGARKIWNQPSYHVTNVNDDGTIPRYEAPSWLLNNTYRTQAAIGPNPNPYVTPNLTASYLRAAQNSAGVHFTVRIGNGGAKEASAGVLVKFFDGSPSGSGLLIGSASTSKVLQPGDYEDVSLSWPGGSAGPHDIYAVVNGTNTVSECRSDDNQAMLTVTIQGAGAVFGPDLVPIRLDLSGTNTNAQTLAISGTARVTLQNKGDASVATAFNVVVFEDSDNDGRYTSGVDNALGTGTNTLTLLPNGANIVDVPLSGNVAFLSAPLAVMVDSVDVVMEQNEGNNVLLAASACEVRPASPIQPVVKWKKPYDGMIYMPPVVANLTDHNGDGKIDSNDVADIVYVSNVSNPPVGKLQVVRGDTGQTVFTVLDPNHPILYLSAIATGDIDNDGFPEIIVQRQNPYALLAYAHDGTLKWDNADKVTAWNSQHPGTIQPGVPVIADLDEDGNHEIIMGAAAFNADGTIRWVRSSTQTGIGSSSAAGASSIVADLDMDGNQEIIAGNTAYNADGTIKWWNNSLTDGLNAVGNLNGGPYPEIVLVTSTNQYPYAPGGRVYLLDHNGNIKWGPVHLNTLEPNGNAPGSPPVIADFDGDGQPEIGIKGTNKFFILDKNGNVKQTLSIPYRSGGSNSAPTIFDLNGDGRPEVLINSDYYFRIFDGRDGTQLYSESFGGTGNNFQNVVIADVDGDGHAEAVAIGVDPFRIDGIRVYGSDIEHGATPWVGARSIWNQTSYHITNVNDDGTIPQHEAPSWLLNNTYLCQASTSVSSSATGTSYSSANLTASYFRVTYDGSALNLLVRVGNSGAADAPSGVVITFYDGAPATDTIIGTVPVSNVLRPGEYEDIAYSIGNPSPGVHQLYAVVDSANAVSECNKNDNQVQLDYTVQDTFPDLKIGFEDISMPTGTIYEGNLVPITVLVRNIGAISASNVVVRMYNGSPVAGGIPVGADQVIPAISSNGTATLVFTYDTLGRRGTSVLYFVADPANSLSETNEANNSASLTIHVEPSVFPDLAVTINDIQLAPLSAVEGDHVLLTATILNRGIATSNIPVRVSVKSGALGEGSEIYTETRTIYTVLDLGQSATVQTVLNTTGWSGQHAVSVSIDPLNTIVESSKDNNIASRPIFIQSAGLTSSTVLNRPVYQANEAVTATITISDNTNTARSLTLLLFVQDSAGNRIATIVPSDPVAIAANGTVTFTRTWNTGSTFAGIYTIAAEFSEAGKVKAISSAGFNIAPDTHMSAGVTVDKVSYNPNQTVALTSTITSRSVNYVQENLIATATIGNLQSTIFTDTRTISGLMPGAAYTFKSYWNTGSYPAGVYPVLLEVKDSTGALILTGTATVTITNVIKPSAALRGLLSVDKQSLLTGETVSVSYGVSNVGNIDLAQVGLSVLTVHAVNQTVYNTITSQATITMGGTYDNSGAIDTTNYSAKDYLVILRANINGIEETLAGTYFRVEGAPSAPSLASPAMNADVETFTPTLSVNNASDPNDDKLTYEFEVYGDSGLESQITVSSGQGTVWTIPILLTENQTYFWRSRAYDGKLYGDWMSPASFRVNTANDPPTAPTVSSPADNGVVDTLTPVLVVNNASDPDSSSLTYNYDIALDPDFTQIVASKTGVFEGTGMTSWQLPLNLVENTTYYWRCQADDWLITGSWMSTAKFFVNTANDAPTAPVIIAPLKNSEVTTLSPDIVVVNSTDPDSSVLSYFFEVDTAPTFDSSGIIRSGSIPAGQGTTTWQVTGLQDNTQYYVHAKANDGQTDGPWSNDSSSSVHSFFVNTMNDPPTAPVLANPSDGAGVNVDTPTLSVHNATDPDRDVLTYEFEVYADAALTTLVTGSAGVGETAQITSWIVPISLTECTTYYRRSRSSDGMLVSEWMPKASFMVNKANDAPGAPELSSPAEGSSVATLKPTLSVKNAVDPDSDTLTYDFEIYTGDVLVQSIAHVPQDNSGITSVTLTTALQDNTAYQWLARAHDGDRYGPPMDKATFTTHLPQTGIGATIDFDPNTLNKTSNGTWVVVYIELPVGYKVADINVSSVRLNGTIPAETWPYAIGDHDKDGIPDLMVKFKRSDVINLLPNGEQVTVHVTGRVGSTTFDGVDIIRVMK